MLWRGVWHDRPCPVRLIVVVVPGLRLKPWYLLTTDLALAPVEAVEAYSGRQQIEVNFDEVKELGLGHYQGRSGEGVRRWPIFLCIVQTLLKLIATQALTLELPSLNWPWYKQENTVGQIRRRLIAACCPRISRTKASDPTEEKLKKSSVILKNSQLINRELQIEIGIIQKAPALLRHHDRAHAEFLTALTFLGTALLLRLPALFYSVINFDESLYLLIGKQLTEGILPFTGLCDRKPFGLFALFGLFAAMPFDAIIASRLGASIAVGLTAYMLHHIAGLLFDDEDRLIGPAAGLAYVVFSLANGGMASNSEVFLSMFTVLGLLLTLLAVRGAERPHLGLMLAAGLVFGLGVQVKQTILFDMLAFLVGFYLLTTARLADLGLHLRATAPSLAALAAVSALPTIAVIVLYI